VFHRIQPRIRAHILLCWPALLLIRVAGRRTGLTWRRIALDLGRLHAVTLQGPAGTVTQTTEPTDVAAPGVNRRPGCGIWHRSRCTRAGRVGLLHEGVVTRLTDPRRFDDQSSA